MQVGDTEVWDGREKAAEHGLRLSNLRAIGGPFSFESPVSLNSTTFTGPCRVGFLTYIGIGSRIACTEIGRFCSIAPTVVIGPAEHPLDWVSSHPFAYNGTKQFTGLEAYEGISGRNNFRGNDRKTIIGNDVLIGDGAFIKRGVSIGHGAVVGARSVVTRDVGPYEIVAGNPAKVIRKRFSEDVIERLLASEWWNYDLSNIPKKSFTNVDRFLSLIETARDLGKLEPQSYRLVSSGPSLTATRIT